MHVIITDRISEKIEVADRTAFLLGGIAPDAVSSKDFSHFFSGNVADYSRTIDYHAFWQKYYTLEAVDYVCGYFTHLVADDIWLTGFYLPWLKNRLENDPSMFTKYHNDFRLLNRMLLAHYQLSPQLLDTTKEKILPDLEEVKAADVRSFIPYLYSDMEDQQTDTNKLDAFTFEQIIGYIETSIDKGVQQLQLLK